MGFIKGTEDALKSLFATIAMTFIAHDGEETLRILAETETTRKANAEQEAVHLEQERERLGL